ncbi:MAG: hypothetical protein KDN22_26140 [Verrucomicrobiae bacterium]|nr:hypothetical protein [Verrucomicrobiae bacterium]
MKHRRPDRATIILAIVLMQCAIAAALPLFQSDDASLHRQQHTGAVTWPTKFEGANLTPIELDAKATAALQRFPGEAALFSDGSRYVLLRQVTRATRQLHSSADCLQGMGHQIRSRTIITRREDGSRWARFTTDMGIEACEQIRSSRTQKTWTDVSAWFWDATFHSEDGPWLAVTLFSSDFRSPDPSQ